MRRETDLATRPAVSRRAAPIALACVLAMAGLACPADAPAAVAAATTTAAALAHAPGELGVSVALEERSLPSEDLASPAASAAASPASPAPPSGAPSPGGAGDQGGGAPAGAPVAGEPAPAATPTDAPPPYDVGSIQPTAPVSEQPLTALIASTKDQPALNASLRFAEQGRKSLESSKPDDAIRDLGRAISIDPTDPYAYFYLGRAYMIKKDYPQALAFFGRSEVGLRTVPAWLGEVKSFEGACLEEQGKFPAAAAAYKQALDAAPGNLMARTGYGRLSESLSDTNANNTEPPPPPLDGAALPAPEVDLAAPAPAEAPPAMAQPDQPGSGADWSTDSSDDSGGTADGRSDASGAKGNP